ncbi:hypothetical protein CRE_10551 [Caenorhabditis remanei]|uniref:F-box domain-containing protein n=1 Tax=Caenorhabditis remanei TaxID=31234 RepID=E3N777_CAERE|nr:hypothetical protein CRE_10551 [Caenorhabditis remanei]
MSSEFPLFLLPMIVFNNTLKLMTPFELVAISLCSKKSKMICKSARSQLQCKNSTKEFTLKFSLSKEIRLKFDYYPSLEWVFKLECFPKIDNVPPKKNILRKFFSIFRNNHRESQTPSYTRVANNLFINTWIPTEDDTTSEQSLQLFTTEEFQTSNINLFIQYLSDVFNIPLVNIELHFQDFIREENERIIDFYCRDQDEKSTVRSLTLIGKYWNTPEDDEVVDSLLRRQEAQIKLNLFMKPTDDFKYQAEHFRNKLNFLKVQFAHWISFQQFLEIDFYVVTLLNSTFKTSHLKLFFEKWSSGWTPKWRVATIEYAETIKIDECVNELSVMGSFSNIQVQREEMLKNLSNEESKTTQYYLRRPDGMVGVASMESETFGGFYIFTIAELNIKFFPHLYN